LQVEALNEPVVKALDKMEVQVSDVVEVEALGEGEAGIELLLRWYSSAYGGRQQ